MNKLKVEKTLKTAGLMAVSILLLFLIFKVSVAYCNDLKNNDLKKLYLVGGVASGFFAFGAFFVTILINRKQSKTSNLQRFETTLFNMLSLQQQIVNDFSFKDTYKEVFSKDAKNPNQGKLKKELINKKRTDGKIINGREAFNFFFNEREYLDFNLKIEYTGMRGVLSFKGLNIYCISNSTTFFDHYFRHLYTIIKFIDKSFLNKEEKYQYASMVRATLSRFELVWLYYNALSDLGNKKFKPLIEKYSLLKNIREELLTLSKINIEKFPNFKYPETIKYLKEEGYTGTDYEFFLTDKKEDKNKYHFKAFYNGKDDEKTGENLVTEFESFLTRLEDSNKKYVC